MSRSVFWMSFFENLHETSLPARKNGRRDPQSRSGTLRLRPKIFGIQGLFPFIRDLLERPLAKQFECFATWTLEDGLKIDANANHQCSLEAEDWSLASGRLRRRLTSAGRSPQSRTRGLSG